MDKKLAYVTQYALSAGIRCVEIIREDDDGYANVKWPGGLNGSALFNRNQWSSSAEDAVKRANAMRVAKIASLQKQITKLEKLTFKLPEAQS